MLQICIRVAGKDGIYVQRENNLRKLDQSEGTTRDKKTH